MAKKKNNLEYEQISIFSEEVSEATDTSRNIESCAVSKEFKVGAKIRINSNVRLFCDGYGIPDYAREAYIKRINEYNKTIVIETKPNGKQLGVLLQKDVVVIDD